MNIIGKRNLYLSISATLVTVSVIVIIAFGFAGGVEFRGGTLWQFQIIENTPLPIELESFIESELKVGDIRLNYDAANKSFLARLPELDEEEHQSFLEILRGEYPALEELSFQSIGPSIGAELRKNAILAIVFALVAVSLYIAFAFRKTSKPVSSWKYGAITMATLFHDIVIPAGLLALLGHLRGVEIDSTFIVALLVIMGFSVHDTIVVFDRTRENLGLKQGKTEFSQIVNQSVNQTIARSINTSLTLILVLVALYFLGPINLKYFLLALIVGTTVGVYSSIFVASPLLVVWHTRR